MSSSCQGFFWSQMISAQNQRVRFKPTGGIGHGSPPTGPRVPADDPLGPGQLQRIIFLQFRLPH
jgi:hypothetical protein